MSDVTQPTPETYATTDLPLATYFRHKAQLGAALRLTSVARDRGGVLTFHFEADEPGLLEKLRQQWADPTTPERGWWEMHRKQRDLVFQKF